MSKPATTVRRQPRDPLGGRRLDIRGTTEDVADRVARAIAVRRDLRAGIVTPENARLQLAHIRRGGGLRLKDAFFAHIRRNDADWVKRGESMWRRRIAPSLDLAVHELTRPALESWRESQRAAGKSEGTIAACWYQIRAAVNVVVLAGETLAPADWGAFRCGGSRRGPVNRERPRDADEVQRLINAAIMQEAGGGGLRDLWVRVAVLCCLGPRQGEACGLSWSDIDWDAQGGDGVIHFRRQVTDGWRRSKKAAPDKLPKGGAVREQRLNPTARTALQWQRGHLEALGYYTSGGPVFPGGRGPHRGSWRSHAELIRPTVWRRVWAAAGLPNAARAVPHGARHAHATITLRAYDARTAQQVTGHRDLRVLEGYWAAERAMPSAPIAQLLPASMVNEIAGTRHFPSSGSTGAPPDECTGGGADDDDWTAIHAAWVARGSPGVRPARITHEANQAYTRAYRRADKPVANSRGKAARRALLASWSAFLRRQS